jgi:hypothetical protein
MLEGVQIYFSHLRDYEISKGRPNLEKFIDEMNKIEAYTQTKNSPQYLLDVVAKEHLKVTLDSNSHLFSLPHFDLPILYYHFDTGDLWVFRLLEDGEDVAKDDHQAAKDDHQVAWDWRPSTTVTLYLGFVFHTSGLY